MTDTFDVLNPANGSVIQTITRDSEKAIEEKLEKGYKAFKKWKKTNAHERSKLLKDWSALIQKHKESIAKVMTEEMVNHLLNREGKWIMQLVLLTGMQKKQSALTVDWFLHMQITNEYK